MRERLDDWLLEQDRAVSLAEEVVTVLSVVATVAALLVVCWRLTDWWLW